MLKISCILLGIWNSLLELSEEEIFFAPQFKIWGQKLCLSSCQFMLPSTMFYTHRSLLSAVILSRIQFPSPCFVCCLQCSPNQLHLWTKIASLWSLLMKIIYLHYGKSFTFDPSSLTSPSYMYQKERMSFIWPYSAWP